MLKAMSKFQGVLKMFILGMLKTILKTVLKYEKNTITLYGTCWNWAADFVFLLRFCTRKRSETYLLQIFLLIFVYFLGNFEVYCPPSPFAQHFHIQCFPLEGGVIENEFNLRSKEYLPAPTCHFQCIEYVSGVFRYFPPSVSVNKPVCVHPNLELPNNFFKNS